MTMNLTYNDNTDDIDEDIKKISLFFVDSIYNKIKTLNKSKDPLNSNAKEFYSRQPRKTIEGKRKNPNNPNKKNNQKKKKKIIQ